MNKRLAFIERLRDIAEKLSHNPSMSKDESQSIISDLYVVLFEIRDNFSILQEAKMVEKKLASFSQNALPVQILIFSISSLANAIAKTEGVFTKSDIARASLIDSISNMSDENVTKLAAYASTLSES